MDTFAQQPTCPHCGSTDVNNEDCDDVFQCPSCGVYSPAEDMVKKTFRGAHGSVEFYVDQYGVPHLTYLGIEIMITRSSTDETRLIEIDTTGTPENDEGPEMRIYLNDYTLHENPPFPGR